MTSEVLDVWSLASQFGNEFTPAEFRQFLRIRKSQSPFTRFFLDRDPPPLNSRAEEDQEQQIRALLGPRRYTWYQRAMPFSFRHFQREIASLGFPIYRNHGGHWLKSIR